MGKISDISTDSTVEPLDKLLGTDGSVNNSGATKNYTVGDLRDYFLLSIINTTLDFSDDAAASVGGVVLGGLYHTSGTVKIRLV